MPVADSATCALFFINHLTGDSIEKTAMCCTINIAMSSMNDVMQVHILRSQPQSEWQMKTVREVLQRSGVDMAALLERHEVLTACQQQLHKLPRPEGADSTHVTYCVNHLQALIRVNFEHAQEVVSCVSNTCLRPQMTRMHAAHNDVVGKQELYSTYAVHHELQSLVTDVLLVVKQGHHCCAKSQWHLHCAPFVSDVQACLVRST